MTLIILAFLTAILVIQILTLRQLRHGNAVTVTHRNYYYPSDGREKRGRQGGKRKAAEDDEDE